MKYVGDVAANRDQRRRLVAQDGRERFDRGRPVERALAGKKLVDNRAERELVAFEIGGLSGRLSGDM